MVWRRPFSTASIGLREDDLAGVPARFAGMHTHGAFRAGTLERDAPHGGLGLFLDGSLAGRFAAVGGVDEAVLDHLLELFVGLGVERLLLPEVERPLEQRVVERRQRRRDSGRQLRERHGALVAIQPVGERADARLEDTWTDLDAQRHALLLPLVELAARTDALPVVDLDAHTGSNERTLNVSDGRHHAGPGIGVVGAVDRQYYYLVRRQLRRHDQPLVVAVPHDQRADEARAEAPRGGLRERLLVVLIVEADVESASEVLAHVVAGARLQRLAIAHHRLDGQR